MFLTAFDTFGRKERNQEDWFQVGVAQIEPAITAERNILLAFKRDPCANTLAALRSTRHDARIIAGRCANDYWLNVFQSVQLSADLGNVREMYEGMKRP